MIAACAALRAFGPFSQPRQCPEKVADGAERLVALRHLGRRGAVGPSVVPLRVFEECRISLATVRGLAVATTELLRFVGGGGLWPPMTRAYSARLSGES